MNLDQNTQVKVTERDLERIKRCVEKCRDEFGISKYQGISHFFRCAALRLLKEEGY